MAVAYKVLGENKSVFDNEKFSRVWRYSTSNKETIKELTQKIEEEGSSVLFRFKVLDDDGITYFWGVCTSDSSFAPLDNLGEAYGCTSIMYKNKSTGKYEYL